VFDLNLILLFDSISVLFLPFPDLAKSVPLSVLLTLGEDLHVDVGFLLLLLLTAEIPLLLLELALSLEKRFLLF